LAAFFGGSSDDCRASTGCCLAGGLCCDSERCKSASSGLGVRSNSSMRCLGSLDSKDEVGEEGTARWHAQDRTAILYCVLAEVKAKTHRWSLMVKVAGHRHQM
jgi:hypothetical protein